MANSADLALTNQAIAELRQMIAELDDRIERQQRRIERAQFAAPAGAGRPPFPPKVSPAAAEQRVLEAMTMNRELLQAKLVELEAEVSRAS
jgi:hypothetical protein